METSEANEWPAYNVGSKDHLHAVGVLVATWAEIEQAYQAMIQGLFGADVTLALRVHELLGNQGRWSLISDELPKRSPPQFREHIEHFLKCAAICKENRNAVAHAKFVPSNDPQLVVLWKGRDRKGERIRRYPFTVDTIREMADETHTIAHYGNSIWAFMQAQRAEKAAPGQLHPFLVAATRLPLLQKPRVPRKWDQRSQPLTQTAPPPPQSSGA